MRGEEASLTAILCALAGLPVSGSENNINPRAGRGFHQHSSTARSWTVVVRAFEPSTRLGLLPGHLRSPVAYEVCIRNRNSTSVTTSVLCTSVPGDGKDT